MCFLCVSVAVQCHRDCLICSGTPDHCDSCQDPSALLMNGRCLQSCPEEFFAQGKVCAGINILFCVLLLQPMLVLLHKLLFTSSSHFLFYFILLLLLFSHQHSHTSGLNWPIFTLWYFKSSKRPLLWVTSINS